MPLELKIKDTKVDVLPTFSMWDLLMLKPQRRDLSKLRWKVLQQGQPIENHWGQLCELWQRDYPKLVSPFQLVEPIRALRTASKLQDPNDGVIKWLLNTHDGHAIETVFLPSSRSKRATACISSQVGCGVKCAFCATGTLGMIRNLTPSEILEQLLVVREEANRQGYTLRNVVFMGMGEPLHNWDNVQTAIGFMLRDDGFYLSPAHVCVSTAGVVGRMRECARVFPKLRIAVSLHSCDDAVRKKLVPRGVGTLSQIRAAIVELNQEFPARTLWLEVVMIQGVTDRDRDIDLLIEFCRGLNVEINLIPYNRIADSGDSSISQHQRSDRVWDIAQRLRGAGFFTTIRYSGGQNIAAACGQLAASS